MSNGLGNRVSASLYKFFILAKVAKVANFELLTAFTHLSIDIFVPKDFIEKRRTWLFAVVFKTE
jgi:hypothetical protein